MTNLFDLVPLIDETSIRTRLSINTARTPVGEDCHLSATDWHWMTKHKLDKTIPKAISQN